MEQSAQWNPARAGGEYFADPQHPTHRRYEALRAYLYEGYSASEVAEWFGYTPQTVRTLVRDFRAGRAEFFVDAKPGPKNAPAKEAAHERVVELRRDLGLSIDEIAAVLAREGTALNRTGISEIIAAEGLPRLWRRPAAERGVPVVRDRLPRAGLADFDELPEKFDTRFAGMLLALPDLIALDLPGLVKQADYPGTREIPAISYGCSSPGGTLLPG
jgi:transposase